MDKRRLPRALLPFWCGGKLHLHTTSPSLNFPSSQASRKMADEPASAALSWLGYAAVALGATAVGGTVVAGVRRAARVKAARATLHTLLSAAAGTDARIVITGATSGVGEELAREFSRNPSVSLLLGCRDVTRGEQVAAACGNASVVKLDCLDLASVRGFTAEAREFLEAGAGPSVSGLRLVVNNAGRGDPRAGREPGRRAEEGKEGHPRVGVRRFQASDDVMDSSPC